MVWVIAHDHCPVTEQVGSHREKVAELAAVFPSEGNCVLDCWDFSFFSAGGTGVTT
jgi:hypothetical protein